MNIYNRFDQAKNYDRHLFHADRVLQAAELNELQSNVFTRVAGIANVLFSDGAVVRDAGCVVNAAGTVDLQSGAIYLAGAVRGVPPASFPISMVGTVIIGVYLQESVITELEDPALLNPAVGTRGYMEPGAARLQVNPVWGTAGDGKAGAFYPVYTVIDGELVGKEAPPNLDGVAQALARYDRDSAGGTYVVSGMTVQRLPDQNDGHQVYSVAEGRARVFGYPVEFRTARRLVVDAAPDLKPIANEPHLSATAAEQRITVDRSPATAITEVTITAEKTATVTHGVVTGSQDPLPDTSILAILEVKQGATPYAAPADYKLTAGKVDWSPAGNEPAPGSTYTVKYRYLANVEPNNVDDTGFTVSGAVVGTLVLVSYSQMLPRIDRICLDQDGNLTWIRGVAAEWNPELPAVPSSLVSLASIYQTWDARRRVVNDSVRVVPMPVIANFERRLDRAMQLIAQSRLESNIHTREAGMKRGLFVDPFIDDSQRDAGIVQSAAVVRGELVLPIETTVVNVSNDVATRTTCTYRLASALEQPLRTAAIDINPYGAVDAVPAAMRLTPAVDRWTEAAGSISAQTGRFFPVSLADDQRGELQATVPVGEETLRSLDVRFEIAGFVPGETIAQLKFDGMAIAPQAI